MTPAPVVAVVGGGTVPHPVLDTARELGRRLAQAGWTTVTGDLAAPGEGGVGVMDAALEGAREGGGLAVAILAYRDKGEGDVSPHADVHVHTGTGDARNVAVALTCDVMVALQGGEETLTEVALALKNGRPVVALGFEHIAPFELAAQRGRLVVVDAVEDAVAAVARLLEVP